MEILSHYSEYHPMNNAIVKSLVKQQSISFQVDRSFLSNQNGWFVRTFSVCARISKIVLPKLWGIFRWIMWKMNYKASTHANDRSKLIVNWISSMTTNFFRLSITESQLNYFSNSLSSYIQPIFVCLSLLRIK